MKFFDDDSAHTCDKKYIVAVNAVRKDRRSSSRVLKPFRRAMKKAYVCIDRVLHTKIDSLPTYPARYLYRPSAACTSGKILPCAALYSSPSVSLIVFLWKGGVKSQVAVQHTKPSLPTRSRSSKWGLTESRHLSAWQQACSQKFVYIYYQKA